MMHDDLHMEVDDPYLADLRELIGQGIDDSNDEANMNEWSFMDISLKSDG